VRTRCLATGFALGSTQPRFQHLKPDRPACCAELPYTAQNVLGGRCWIAGLCNGQTGDRRPGFALVLQLTW